MKHEKRAVILGELASKSKRTGKVVETAFAFVLTIAGHIPVQQRQP
jgi:hypothetical protein